jgi:hypothetical protein
MADENTETKPAAGTTETAPEDNKLSESVNTDDNAAALAEGDDEGNSVAGSADDKIAKPIDDGKADKGAKDKGKKEKNVPLARFLKQNSELQAARARTAELERLIEAGAAKKDEKTPLSAADIQKLAREEANRIARDEKFNERSNEIYGAGVKQYSKTEFDGAIDTIKTVGLIPVDMIDVLSDLGDGHKILKHLADDLDETERLFSLSPTKRAIELTKLHTKVTAVPRKQISNAPDPVRPIGGGTKAPTIDIYDKRVPASDRIKEMRRQQQAEMDKKRARR